MSFKQFRANNSMESACWLLVLMEEMKEEVVELEVEELAAGLVGCTKGTPINVIFFMADNAFCTFARVAVKR